MNYVIPVKDENEAELAVENAINLGYTDYAMLWTLMILDRSKINCIYLFYDGYSMIGDNHKLEPTFEKVNLDNMLLNIEPFKNSYDVGNT